MINGPEVAGSEARVPFGPIRVGGRQGAEQGHAAGVPGTRRWRRMRMTQWAPRAEGRPSLAPGPAPRRGPRSKVWSHGRRAPVPPRADPLAESLLPPLPGQDKGSLTRDGTTLHKWDWSESEPETARKRRERQGPRAGRGDGRLGWPRRAAPRRPAWSTGRRREPGNEPGLPEPRGDSPGGCGARVLEARDAGRADRLTY